MSDEKENIQTEISTISEHHHVMTQDNSLQSANIPYHSRGRKSLATSSSSIIGPQGHSNSNN